MYKKNRNVTVIYTSDRNYQKIPTIRIKGKWLKELGFEIGNGLNVECHNGKLIITKADEIWVDEAREV